MPNLHKNFLEYDLEIQGKSKRAIEHARMAAFLKERSRDSILHLRAQAEPEKSIAETISFIENALQKKFEGHQSLMLEEICPEGCLRLGALIAEREGSTQIDIGIHFANLRGVTAMEVFEYLFDALKGLGQKMPEKKETGIQLTISEHIVAMFYPYLPDKDGQQQLLATSKGIFQVRTPVQLGEWFENKVHYHGPQLPRIARYLNGWLSHVAAVRRVAVPVGDCILVWAASAFQANERDDVAFFNTISNLNTSKYMSHLLQCICPTYPHHNMTRHLESESSTTISHALRELKDDASMAISERLPFENAAKIWTKHFGNRFPSNKV